MLAPSQAAEKSPPHSIEAEQALLGAILNHRLSRSPRGTSRWAAPGAAGRSSEPRLSIWGSADVGAAVIQHPTPRELVQAQVRPDAGAGCVGITSGCGHTQPQAERWKRDREPASPRLFK